MEKQKTIRFDEGYALSPSPTLRERIDNAKLIIDSWLDKRSDVYSRICEMEVTRRMAVRVNLFTACGVAVAVCVEQHPVAVSVAVFAAAWMLHRADSRRGNGGEGGER